MTVQQFPVEGDVFGGLTGSGQHLVCAELLTVGDVRLLVLQAHVVKEPQHEVIAVVFLSVVPAAQGDGTSHSTSGRQTPKTRKQPRFDVASSTTSTDFR